MAKVHGRAGAYPERQARRRLNLIMGVFLGVIMLWEFGLGFAWTNLAVLHTILGAVLGLGISLALLTGVLKLLERYFESVHKERLRYVRGQRAEALVGLLLDDLPDTWHVFHGIQLHPKSDLDHVVVGPGGVFYLSTKSTRGQFTKGAGEQLLWNGQPVVDLRRALGQAKDLHERMSALMQVQAPFVQAVLAVPFAWVAFSGPVASALVLHQDNLIETIEGSKRRLTDAQIRTCVDVIETLASKARDLVEQAAKARFPSVPAPAVPVGSHGAPELVTPEPSHQE